MVSEVRAHYPSLRKDENLELEHKEDRGEDDQQTEQDHGNRHEVPTIKLSYLFWPISSGSSISVLT